MILLLIQNYPSILRKLRLKTGSVFAIAVAVPLLFCNFTGFTGGGYFNNYGSGVNYLCLPPDPIWGKSYRSLNYSLLYGAEYDQSGPFFGLNNPDDVPCAVCRSHSGLTKMMLPARNECYTGWRKPVQWLSSNWCRRSWCFKGLHLYWPITTGATGGWAQWWGCIVICCAGEMWLSCMSSLPGWSIYNMRCLYKIEIAIVKINERIWNLLLCFIFWKP